MKLSVVIPCYNSAHTLTTQLEALAVQRWPAPWEVILADNGSTDASRAHAERYRARLPDLRVIDASARRGQSFARNTGARYARGESLAFCDADDEVAPGWVEAIGTAMTTHDFVSSRLKTDKLNPSWKQRYLGEVQGDGLMKAWYPPYLPFAGGCGLAIKRALFERIGGFDESLRSCEDTDLCFRVQLSGTPLTFAPNAVVQVRYRNGLWAALVQARRWAVDNGRLAARYGDSEASSLQAARGQLRYTKTLVRKLTAIRRPEHLARWMFELGWHIGLLQASLARRGRERELSAAARTRA